MKNLASWVGAIITTPFIALEAVIKIILLCLYFPIVLILAIIYPLIKVCSFDWLKKWWIYVTKWENGFYTANIIDLWL